ncbi:hypothetical protein AX14_000389 [Amanita brunnescens Koide BX004]|nr:hypothetical protein AX14_000389 [Amanita brunnescens Koide BX004]
MPDSLFPLAGEAIDQSFLPGDVVRNRRSNASPHNPPHLAPIGQLVMTSIAFPLVATAIRHFIVLIMAYLQGWTPQSVAVWRELKGYQLAKTYHCKNTNSSTEHEFVIFELVDEHMNNLVLRTDRHIGARKYTSTSSSSTSSLIDVGLSPISSLPASSFSSLLFPSDVISDRYPANDTITRIQVPPHPDEALRTIEFNGNRSLRPTLWDVVILILVVHNNSTSYNLLERQCYWHADVIFALLEKWAMIHKNGSVRHRASTGRYHVLPVHSRDPEDITRIWENFAVELQVMTQQKEECERARTEERRTKESGMRERGSSGRKKRHVIRKRTVR